MQTPIPYEDLLGSEDPLDALASSPGRIVELVRTWDARRWSSSYAPGKWTAAQIVLHLAHDEIGWCNRVRLSLCVDGYVVQPYEGASWVTMESPVDPHLALASYTTLRGLNLALYRKISARQRVRLFPHPEMGQISIEWILRTLAGHDLHHLKHLQKIAALPLEHELDR